MMINHVCGQANSCRSLLYRFFTIMFIYPTKENLEVLKNEIFIDGKLEEISKYFNDISNTPQTSQLISLLISIITSMTLSEWGNSYVKTFGHAVGDIPLYETKYFPDNVFRESQRLADINAFYRAFGVKVSKSAKERTDHISIELEFMSFLLQKELYAFSENNNEHIVVCQDAMRKFFNEHLGQWGFEFCKRLIKFSNNELYKTTGNLFQAFLNYERSVFCN